MTGDLDDTTFAYDDRPLSENSALNPKNKSHAVTAEVVILRAAAEA